MSVSRSLQGPARGLWLVVDCQPGGGAQRSLNVYLALENDLVIIPGAQQDRTCRRRSSLGSERSEAIIASTPVTPCRAVRPKPGLGWWQPSCRAVVWIGCRRPPARASLSR